MKRMGMWLLLMTKRLMKKPSFVIILVLLPAILILYRFIIRQDSGTLRACIYVPDGSDRYAEAVADALVNADYAAVFYRVNSEDDLYSDVIAGRAEVGYVFPKDLGQRILKKNWAGSITMVVSDTSHYATFVNEYVTVELFSNMTEDVLTDYLMNRSGLRFDEEELRKTIRENLEKQEERGPVIVVHYRDFYTNEELSEEEVLAENYLTKPIRGTVALFVMLAGFAGLVFWFQDNAEGRFKVMSYEKRPVINYGSLLLPTLLAGIVGLVCILIAGLAGNPFAEIGLMLLYCIFIAGVCELLRMIVPSVNAICAAIPIVAIASYLCCPIILDLKKTVPVVTYLRKILPPNYYLEIFNGTPAWALALAAGIVTAIAAAMELIGVRKA